MEYYALDYINGADGTYELVYNDQLYLDRETAMIAARATGRPELFDITKYTWRELLDVYNASYISLNADLQVTVTYE